MERFRNSRSYTSRNSSRRHPARESSATCFFLCHSCRFWEKIYLRNHAEGVAPEVKLFHVSKSTLLVPAPVGVGNIELVDLVIQGPGADAQPLGGIFLYPETLFQCPQDQVFFMDFQGLNPG